MPRDPKTGRYYRRRWLPAYLVFGLGLLVGGLGIFGLAYWYTPEHTLLVREGRYIHRWLPETVVTVCPDGRMTGPTNYRDPCKGYPNIKWIIL